MILNLKCPSCGQAQQVTDEVLGQKLTCPACGVGFRVSAPKPRATSNPESATYPILQEPAALETSPRPSPAPIRPVAARVSDPSPASRPSGPAASPNRGGLPAWAYAIAGGMGVAALIGIAIAGRTLLGSGSTRYPDPAADIALGVASHPQFTPVAPDRPGTGTGPLHAGTDHHRVARRRASTRRHPRASRPRPQPPPFPPLAHLIDHDARGQHPADRDDSGFPGRSGRARARAPLSPRPRS